MKKITAPLAAFLIVGALPASAALYFDSFESPTGAGTTLGTGLAPVGWNVSLNVAVLSDTATNGTQSLFFRDGTRTATQSSAVPFGGSGDLVFSFDYKGDSTLESPDGLTFSVNFGSGFQTILLDKAVPNGTTSTYTGTTITLDNTDGSSANWFSYSITVPESYHSTLNSGNGLTSFQMRFATDGSSGGENFHLDNISVSAVPEPSAMVLLVAGAGALTLRRRRA